MSSQAYEHSSPVVELRLGASLLPAEIVALTAANSSADPAESVRQALKSYATYAARKAQEELLNVTLVDDALIRHVLDAAWYSFIPFFKKATGPMIAESYIRALQAVDAGDVPIQTIYGLADEYAMRVGRYFNDTSADALVEGFNKLVNRQVPQKVAMQRALAAYGLTPRQMSGYVAAKELQPSKIDSALPQRLQRKVKRYVAESLLRRLKIFGDQEAHTLDEQAKQFAWLWLQDKGKLPAYTKKMWLTAKDEKVCKVCGPMNAKKVGIKENFELPNGALLYTPGAHVNCRCTVKLMIPPVKLVKKSAGTKSLLSKAEWDPMEHPRGGSPQNRGQFSRKPPQDIPRTMEARYDPLLEELEGATELAEKLSALEQKIRLRHQLLGLEQEPKPEHLKPEHSKPEHSLTEIVAPPSLSQLVRGPSLSELVEQKPQEADLSAALPSLVGALPSLANALPDIREAVQSRAARRLGVEPIWAVEPTPYEEIPRPGSRRKIYTGDVPLGGVHVGLGTREEMMFPSRDDAPRGMVALPKDNGSMFYNTDEVGLGDVLTHHADSVIAELVQHVFSHTNNASLDKPDPRYPGEMLRWSASEDDIESALISLANRDNPDFNDDYITIEWRSDRNPERVESNEEIHFSELARRLGVHKSDLDVVMFRTDRGYKGQVFKDSDNTKTIYGEFRILDEHEITEEERRRWLVSAQIPVTIVDIEPIVDDPFVVYEEIDPDEGELLD